MNMTSLAPYNCIFVTGQSIKVPERSHEKPNFRAAIGPEAALEEDLDVFGWTKLLVFCILRVKVLQLNPENLITTWKRLLEKF